LLLQERVGDRREAPLEELVVGARTGQPPDEGLAESRRAEGLVARVVEGQPGQQDQGKAGGRVGGAARGRPPAQAGQQEGDRHRQQGRLGALAGGAGQAEQQPGQQQGPHRRAAGSPEGDDERQAEQAGEERLGHDVVLEDDQRTVEGD
jgi:hypothetical protein